MSSTSETLKAPSKLTYDQIVSDLSSIPINETDVLFNQEYNTALKGENKNNQDETNSELMFEKLEKLILFKLNLELHNDKLSSELSLDSLNKDIDLLDKHVNSLQHFIDISKKFLSINK